MAIRTLNNPFDPTVDQLIGDAYQTVKRVAQDIDKIKHVSYHLESVYTVAENIDKVEQILEKLQDLKAQDVQVEEDPTCELIGGDLQTVLSNLAARITELENA